MYLAHFKPWIHRSFCSRNSPDLSWKCRARKVLMAMSIANCWCPVRVAVLMMPDAGSWVSTDGPITHPFSDVGGAGLYGETGGS